MVVSKDSVGAGQPTPRVDMAQSERVGGQGDQGVGGLLLDPGTKPEELLLHFFGGGCLPHLALLFASSEDTPAESFRVPAVGCQASTWQVGAEGRPQPSLSGHRPHGICLF